MAPQRRPVTRHASRQNSKLDNARKGRHERQSPARRLHAMTATYWNGIKFTAPARRQRPRRACRREARAGHAKQERTDPAATIELTRTIITKARTRPAQADAGRHDNADQPRHDPASQPSADLSCGRLQHQ
jgi:hypothetical protein